MGHTLYKRKQKGNGCHAHIAGRSQETEMDQSTEHLEYVLGCLRERLAKIEENIAQGEKEIEGMHEYYWENYTEMDQYGYEDFDNQQALLGQINANQEQLLLRQRFLRMMDSPYFGRVDFVYEGEEEPETFYIGIGNFSREAGKVPMVYDWRAPVSGLFYDYDKGQAYYDAPGGRMEGEILSKWQYKIRGGKLVYAFENDVKIDDDVLGRELGNCSDVKLKNIISTIQKEQNAIIRNTKDRILVIQGAAGSGKTSIALHRIAYLLYHDRKYLKSSNVLVLSPNSVFSDYISHILPELGEENIREMSFDIFAYHQLKDVVHDCEERCDQIEKELKFPEDVGLFAEKQSKEFAVKLNKYALELEYGLMEFSDFKFKKMEKTEEEIAGLFYSRFPDIPLLSRMDAVMEYVTDEYETLAGRDFEEDEKLCVWEKFMEMYENRDLYVLYSRFLEESGYPSLPRVPREERRLAYEDVYPMLYLKYMLCTCAEDRNIKHLVIDEMQDYSYIQYEILAKLFSCRMTVLGDRAQTMEGAQRDVMDFLPQVLGKDIRCLSLRKSYRNTIEIAEYAERIVGGTDAELFERHGAPVREVIFSTVEEALQEVLVQLDLEKFETAAVLVMTQDAADFAAGYLKCRLEENGFDTEKRFACMDRNSTIFCKGLTVTTFYHAKGLEFDQVFTVYNNTDRTPLHRQAKYICATRALHELCMFEVDFGG